MSVCIGLDVQREASEVRKLRRSSTLSESERERITQGHKETPTTRASPFIVHNTSLFTLHSKLVHFVYSNQLIATEALDKGFQNKKKIDFCRMDSNPFHQIQTGGKEEGGRVQPNVLQGIYSLGFSRAG